MCHQEPVFLFHQWEVCSSSPSFSCFLALMSVSAGQEPSRCNLFLSGRCAHSCPPPAASGFQGMVLPCCECCSAVVLQAMQCHGCHIAVGATGAAELQELWVVQGQTPAASHPLQPGSSCPSLPAVDAHMTLFSKRFRCETHLFWDTLLALW